MHSPVNLKNSKMDQYFFLIVKGVTVTRKFNALISQILVLTVSNYEGKTIKRYARCIYNLHKTFNPSKDKIAKKVTCKHYGTHFCLLKRKR